MRKTSGIQSSLVFFTLLLGMSAINLYLQNRDLLAVSDEQQVEIETPSAVNNAEGAIQKDITNSEPNTQTFSDELRTIEEKIALLESELAALNEKPIEAFQQVTTAAEVAAREEFFRQHAGYKRLLEQAEEARQPVTDDDVRLAQASVMRSIINHLLQMGIGSERVDAMMDELVQAQLESNRKMPLYSLGEISDEEFTAISPLRLLRDLLNNEEYNEYTARTSVVRARQHKSSLNAHISRFTPSMTPARRELIAETYAEHYSSIGVTETDLSRINEMAINRTRNALENEFSESELQEFEAFLQSQRQVPIGVPVLPPRLRSQGSAN
jgi:hypothetical protein